MPHLPDVDNGCLTEADLRTEASASWQHHYNWHRPHSGIRGAVPMSRLMASANKLLTDRN